MLLAREKPDVGRGGIAGEGEREGDLARRAIGSLCLAREIKWLAGGASIQKVAADLGYESAPSFVTMFRKALGASAGRYMAERHPGRAQG